MLNDLIDSFLYFFVNRAMSSILLLQSRNDYGEVINNFFNENILSTAYIATKNELKFNKSMNITLTMAIKNILQVSLCFRYRIVKRCIVVDFSRLPLSCCFIILFNIRISKIKKITTTDARIRLLNLVKDGDNYEKNIILAVESM